MKALYCEMCGDIVAPSRANFERRQCRCGRHEVWWVDGARGIVRVKDRRGAAQTDGTPEEPMAYLLGFHNAWLQWPYRHDAESVAAILEDTPATYLFKQQSSPVCRFRPGETGDSAWAP